VGLDAIAGTRVASTLVPVGRTMTGVGQNTLSIAIGNAEPDGRSGRPGHMPAG